jgi:cation:H+ antiporter
MARGADASELAIANVVGSNITNVLLILGIATMVRSLSVQRTVVYREIIFNILVSVMVLLLAADRLLRPGAGFQGLDLVDGVVLISYFVLFLFYTYNTARPREHVPARIKSEDQADIPKSFLLLVVGAFAVSLGGRWIVDGAIAIAEAFNLSQALIGVTIVALGTSLPELATSISAVRRGHVDIAVGNVVGSNLFNIMWVLGFSATLGDLPFNLELVADTIFMTAVAVLLFLMLTVGRAKHQLSRFEGSLMLIMYVVYIAVSGWESIVVFN